MDKTISITTEPTNEYISVSVQLKYGGGSSMVWFRFLWRVIGLLIEVTKTLDY